LILLTVQLVTDDRSMPYENDLKNTLKAVPSELLQDYETLVVRLVDKDEAKDFNDRFRGINKATNVLAFPAGNSDYSMSCHLGDLLICVPLVISEAYENQISPSDRLIHLFVHGILHLVGFTHEDDSSAIVMEALEIKILGQIGIQSPYEGLDRFSSGCRVPE